MNMLHACINLNTESESMHELDLHRLGPLERLVGYIMTSTEA